MTTLLKAGGLALFATFLFRLLNRSDPARLSPHFPVVRDAGPEEQEGLTAADWDLVDEQSDESFPASDPPGNY
jgi:hypothetical protein